MQVLSDVFGNKIISSGIWSARPPDFNPCDFFFWGYLKDKVTTVTPEQKKYKKIFIRNCKYSCRIASKGKSQPLPLVSGMSTCMGTAFATLPVICEL
jgi:hypothetical protein